MILECTDPSFTHSFTLTRFGGGSKGSLNTIATYMGSSAATFGFFMAVGSVIRTEGPEALRTTPLVPSQIPRQTLPWAFRARGLEELKVETLPRPERKH